ENFADAATPNPLTTAALANSSGDMVIVAAGGVGLGSYTAQNGFTEQLDVQFNGGCGDCFTHTVADKAATGSNETPSMQHTGLESQAIIGFVLQKAGAAGGDTTPDTFNFTDPTNVGLSTVFEAENYTTTSSLDAVPHIWELKTTTAGYSGTGYMEGTPNSANCTTGTPPTTCGADMTYDFTVTVAGTHYVHFRVDSPSTSDNSFHWGIDGSWLEVNNTAVGSWMWDTGGVQTGSLTAATHTLNVWMRESGEKIDQIVINQSATPHVESNIVQVTGIDNGTAISIDGGGLYEYRICTDVNCASVAHAYASTAGTIDAGEYVQLRLISSASESTATVATVTVGTLAVDWSVTTGDFTPTTFNFTDQPIVALSTQRDSDIVQVNGMDNGTAISIDGSGSYTYRVCNDNSCSGGPSFISTGSTIDAGKWVQLRLTSSASPFTAIVATVTVGTLAVDWSVTTASDSDGNLTASATIT
ncbi:MAG: hypothetical protein ACE1ZA_09770, partial [Pseudomonadales bacterium]